MARVALLLVGAVRGKCGTPGVSGIHVRGVEVQEGQRVHLVATTTRILAADETADTLFLSDRHHEFHTALLTTDALPDPAAPLRLSTRVSHLLCLLRPEGDDATTVMPTIPGFTMREPGGRDSHWCAGILAAYRSGSGDDVVQGGGGWGPSRSRDSSALRPHEVVWVGARVGSASSHNPSAQRSADRVQPQHNASHPGGVCDGALGRWHVVNLDRRTDRWSAFKAHVTDVLGPECTRRLRRW